jgi:threonine dehydratase
LLVKPESLQPTGSFKLRGAYAAISALSPAERQRGVVAHSSGNHGYAVAYAAGLLGVKAAIVVPRNAPKVKTDAIVACGAELALVEPAMDARLAGARQIAEDRGYAMIPPFDDARVIAGQGTIGLEIAEDLEFAQNPAAVLVPVSGGGLISGIAVAIRALLPDAVVIGVEPELAADARDSLRRGAPVQWPVADVARTAADALRVEKVGDLTFAHMRELVSGIVTVTEEQLLTAVRRLALEARLISEPGGAAAVAAALNEVDGVPHATPERPLVAVLSGGNIAPDLLTRVLSEGSTL